MTAIYCFSGTGNSLEVARRLSARLNAALFMIGAAETTVESASDVVWVFPTYAWGIPPLVRQFMLTVSDRHMHGARHHMVCTCGDDVGHTHLQWRETMEQRSWAAYGAYSITMPNTYVLFPFFDVDTKQIAADKLNRCEARIEEVADKIATGFKGDDVTEGSFPGLKSGIINPLFVRFAMSPRPFRATVSCIGCGKCAIRCPLKNITFTPGSLPIWGDNCALCLRCYHQCPRHAIAYGNLTHSKGQYLHPNF
ncbi:MAG: EFR1 family ferrodoxin [Muribaculum sp.]|nr:EFR1 family ferrodoxin [Muribaculaceae bacterium]MCM1080155.1 EFR1 family ferrodoxin [Muribaculum sp.]